MRAKLSRLKELYLHELISLEEYRKDQEPLEARLEALAAEARAAQAPDFSQVEAPLSQGWRAVYCGLDRRSQRDFWRLLLREVRVFPDRSVGFDLAV